MISLPETRYAGPRRVEIVSRNVSIHFGVTSTHARHAGGASARPQTADGVAAEVGRGCRLDHRVGGRSCRGLCKAFLAPRVVIKEATADVEILVIAGWQGDPFVFGKPLRESDHSASRRRWPA